MTDQTHQIHDAGRSLSRALLGIATKDEILILAGIEDADCIACVTPNDTENIVIALGARHLNGDVQIVSRVDHDTNMRKCERAGSDIVISPAQSGAQQIVQCILNPALARIMNSDKGAKGSTLVELHVEDGSYLDGVSIGEYGSQHPQRPRCEDLIRSGDTLIVAGNLQSLA